MSRLIVIAEDTPALAASLALAFEHIGDVEAVVFGNAREAMSFVKQQQHALSALVTDLNLPDTNGFALIRSVRSMERNRHVPAILITAQENPPVANGDILGRPNVVIQKPFSMKEVRRVLETLL